MIPHWNKKLGAVGDPLWVLYMGYSTDLPHYLGVVAWERSSELDAEWWWTLVEWTWPSCLAWILTWRGGSLLWWPEGATPFQMGATIPPHPVLTCPPPALTSHLVSQEIYTVSPPSPLHSSHKYRETGTWLWILYSYVTLKYNCTNDKYPTMVFSLKRWSLAGMENCEGICYSELVI